MAFHGISWYLILIQKIELKLSQNNQCSQHIRQASSMTCNALYQTSKVHHKVCVPFSNIPNFARIEEHLKQIVSNEIDGKCIPAGFVKPGSCVLQCYSVGTFLAGNIQFVLDIECMICCPKEGTVISCVAKTVTQAGIRAYAFSEPSPVVVYVSREMYDAVSKNRLMANSMDSIKPGDVIQIRVVGRRFELNDKHVSIIGELVSAMI